jgi:hypothetical protein
LRVDASILLQVRTTIEGLAIFFSLLAWTSLTSYTVVGSEAKKSLESWNWPNASRAKWLTEWFSHVVNKLVYITPDGKEGGLLKCSPWTRRAGRASQEVLLRVRRKTTRKMVVVVLSFSCPLRAKGELMLNTVELCGSL